MKTKMIVKILIDFFMLILLLLLMTYQITGQELHEWFGAGMLLLFLAHHLLNLPWYRNLFRGKYHAVRILGTIINFAMLAAILLLGYSGIVVSRHLFAFLPITSGIAAARVIHLAASHWGFLLMNFHLGIHWGMIIRLFQKLTRGKTNVVLKWGMRLLAAVIAGYGAVCLFQNNIFSYLFLQTEFAFYDFEKSIATVFGESVAMMVVWIFLGYYTVKVLKK